MGGHLLLLTALMLITMSSPALCASDGCQAKMAPLREQEKLLKNKLRGQERRLYALRRLYRPGNKDDTRVVQNLESQYMDCSHLFKSGFKSSGFYSINPLSSSPVRVYCDMSEGGGWTVIQRRTKGTESFNRSWLEYKNGFGDMHSESGEFWLGNDNLHYISTQGTYTLRINLEDFDGNQRYAEYENFKVADEKNQYRLTFGAYEGTAGDALSGNYEVGMSDWASHQNMKFSAYDRDNDNYKGSCARENKGGWWFNKCHSAHLNGLYYPNGYYSAMTDDGIVWYTWRGWWYSLKTSVMKLRPADFRTTLLITIPDQTETSN